jgi:hypothetical protein
LDTVPFPELTYGDEDSSELPSIVIVIGDSGESPSVEAPRNMRFDSKRIAKIESERSLLIFITRGKNG